MKKLLLIFTLLTASLSFSQDESIAKIDEFLNYLFENDKFMGSLVIRKGDTIVFKNAYGFYEANRGLRSNGNTKYKIGSVTKTFTATMIMQLVEAKKLRLETKISRFFPKIAMANYISVNDLLQQRSGIMDYVNADETFKEKLITGESREDLLERIADYEAIFEPGTKHMYSNTNYYLLGCIIENITKKSYAENLKELIVDKIGLKNTYYSTEKTDVSKRESYSYLYNGTNWEQFPEWDNSIAFASGGITSTPDDMTLFISSLFEGKLVSKSSVDQMKKIKDGYGMGLMQFPFGERR
ncbi:serine hydrolase domain-containing protein, partial [Flavobacterium sp.]|uniref:serine hydrolase domain-containing protein n=1 Tax=Flavobacterium sp. TaxID=239 RepID=UPI0035B3A36F